MLRKGRRKAVLRHDAKLAISWDGNSIFASLNATAGNGWSSQVHNRLVAMGRDVLTQNTAVSGQTWNMMNGNDGQTSADASGLYYPGRTNILICGETTNSVYKYGVTPATALSQAQTYIQNRFAEHPDWLIIMVGTIPRYEAGGFSWGSVAAANQKNREADALMKAACRGWGVKAFIDPCCPGSPWNFPSYNLSDFQKDPHLWSDSYIHPADPGYSVLADMVVRQIVNLAPR